MSFSYYLVCVDCGTSIHLGKTVAVNYKGVADSKVGFAALGDCEDAGNDCSNGAWAELQHFLMVHRGHELRVVPETVQHRDSSIEFVFPTDDDTNDPLFNRSTFFESGNCEPDPITDANNLSDDVIRRLKDNTPT